MAIRQLPIVGRPTDAPAPLRKIAIEEHFIAPTLVQPNYGDSFSGEFDQQGSSYAGFNPEFAEVVNARLHDLRDGRIEEMDAAGIDIAVISHTIGGVEGIPDPAVAKIVTGWPARIRAERAARLGLTPDPDFDSVIRTHLAESRP